MCCIFLHGQNRQFSLSKTNTQLFKNSFYVYGFSSIQKSSVLCIYKLNQQLIITDSLIVSVSKTGIENYLDLSSDTLHDYLNIYLQKKEKKTVSIFRFDKNFIPITTIENADIARLNSISNFENELFYFKNSVYTIKNQKDSAGLQFFLNKYTVKSEIKNFEYDFTWQFPFERKNIKSVHIFYADRKTVLLYVNLGGQKEGQWILTVDAISGKLIKGSRLNDRIEAASYQFGDFIADTVKKTLTLLGQKFSDKQFKQSDNRLAISNAQNVLVYLVTIDSSYAVSERQDFKIPVSEPKTNSKKNMSQYVLRINQLKKNSSGKVSFEADIFRNTDNSLTFLYSNTNTYTIDWLDDALALEKNVVTLNPQIENYFLSVDKLDINGKLSVDSLKDFGTLFYKMITFPVRKKYRIDASGNPSWVLSKSTTKKGLINYSYLCPIKKISQVTSFEDISKSENPVFVNWFGSQFLIGRQVDEKIYQIKLYNWLAP